MTAEPFAVAGAFRETRRDHQGRTCLDLTHHGSSGCRRSLASKHVSSLGKVSSTLHAGNRGENVNWVHKQQTHVARVDGQSRHRRIAAVPLSVCCGQMSLVEDTSLSVAVA